MTDIIEKIDDEEKARLLSQKNGISYQEALALVNKKQTSIFDF